MKRALIAFATISSLTIAGCSSSNTSESATETASSKETETRTEVTKALAKQHCETLVEDSLVSPSTADFPGITKWTFTEISDGFQASAYVDSENSMGGTVRSEFQCTVTAAPGNSDNVLRKLDYLR